MIVLVGAIALAIIITNILDNERVDEDFFEDYFEEEPTEEPNNEYVSEAIQYQEEQLVSLDTPEERMASLRLLKILKGE